MTAGSAVTGSVVVDVRDGVADVRLRRPDKLNALDRGMFEALVGIGEQLADDPGVRVVVLSDGGRGFCAGLDTARFAAMASGTGADGEQGGGYQRIGALGPRAASVWRELAVPVIAAIHGVAFGAGLQLALGADVRLVAADARLALPEVRWGLILTGRTVSGSEAVDLGWRRGSSTTRGRRRWPSLRTSHGATLPRCSRSNASSIPPSSDCWRKQWTTSSGRSPGSSARRRSRAAVSSMMAELGRR